MAPHWRAKKKHEWDMGTYETTELCLLSTTPRPRAKRQTRMPSSA